MIVDPAMAELVSASQRHAEKMLAVARVAGGLSHDVGDLLEHAAASLREVMMAGATAGESRDQLEQAAGSLARAALLARQLEALSRTAPTSPVPRALGRTVSELLPLSTRLAGAAIQVIADAIDVDTWITADAGQIEQVVFHLVVNARDAMQGGGTLTIAVRRLDLERPQHHRYGVVAPGSWVILDVRDTGCGMSDAVLARLFEPFFTTKAPGLGSGLGLATVYGIARQLGGQVVVDSVIGRGTGVALFIPAQAAVNTATIGTTASAAVLVVDDDEWVRAVTARSLRRAGYGVLEAADANAALNLLGDVAGQCVQIVLADIGMPGMSGRALAATLADRWPAIRVILMSGREPGAVGHGPSMSLLHKPFSHRQLLAAIAG